MEHDTSGGGEVAKRAAIGRPAMYDDELAREVCERVAASDVGLLWVCRADDMPSATTVKKWLATNETFAAMYARAKQEQGAHQGERAVQAVIEEPDPARARVLLDAFKWSAAKLAPKTYGDRIAHTNAAGDGDARLEVVSLVDELAGLLNVTPKALNKPAEALPASAPPRD
jgi:lactam utilization protein B